jgi:hypothetical protein
MKICQPAHYCRSWINLWDVSRRFFGCCFRRSWLIVIIVAVVAVVAVIVVVGVVVVAVLVIVVVVIANVVVTFAAVVTVIVAVLAAVIVVAVVALVCVVASYWLIVVKSTVTSQPICTIGQADVIHRIRHTATLSAMRIISVMPSLQFTHFGQAA